MASESGNGAFPWHLGVYDAHCHPTDTMSSISSIPTMKARVLTVMATRGQDQGLVMSVAASNSIRSPNPEDWKREECILPCFGWHPWFSHQMYVDEGEVGSKREGELEGEEKIKHYQQVLQPSRTDLSEEDKNVFLSLPNPLPFSEFLNQTRSRLEEYPLALIGEIGLDRSFRIPEAWIPELEKKRDAELTPGGREGRRLSPFRVDLKHQKKIVQLQLQLAAEKKRAVSIHGVQAHGMVFEVLKELYAGHEKKVLSKKERKKQGQAQAPTEANEDQTPPEESQKSIPYPPRICLHSYSGNPSNFKQYLNPAIPIEVFASFSTAINLSDALEDDTPKSFEDMIKAVPDHMLLVESDLHVAGEDMDRRLEDVVRRICAIKGWSVEEGVKRLGANWRRFAFGAE